MSFSHSDDHERVARNLANPGAATNCFASGLVANGKVPVIRVSVVPSTTSVVQVQEKLGAVTIAFNINKGATIAADSMESFDITAIAGATYNVQFVTSQTGNSAVIKKVHLQQIEA